MDGWILLAAWLSMAAPNISPSNSYSNNPKAPK